MRERDKLKKQLSQQREMWLEEKEALTAAKDQELKDAVRTEQSRWQRDFDNFQQKMLAQRDSEQQHRDAQAAERGGGEADVNQARLQAHRDVEEKRREVVQAQRERDRLKVDLDESRRVIEQLSELLHSKGMGMIAPPVNMPIQRTAPLTAQRSGPLGPTTPPQVAGHGEVPWQSQGVRQSPVALRSEPVRQELISKPESSHSQSPSTEPSFPPLKQVGEQQVSNDGLGVLKPVGMYSDRAGRLFAM